MAASRSDVEMGRYDQRHRDGPPRRTNGCDHASFPRLALTSQDKRALHERDDRYIM